MKKPEDLDYRTRRLHLAQALAYASEMLKHLGLPHDEPSNRADMNALLDAMGGDVAEHAPGLRTGQVAS